MHCSFGSLCWRTEVSDGYISGQDHTCTVTKCVNAQVEVVANGLGAERGPAAFLFYPGMPGNSTARPAEKWALQARARSLQCAAVIGHL